MMMVKQLKREISMNGIFTKMKTRKLFPIIFFYLLIVSFSVRAQTGMDCDSFCVESIILDSNVTNGFIVTIKNNNTEHVNYPTIDVIDKATNTLIATDSGMFMYFAHIQGQSLAYPVFSNTSLIPDSAIVTITDNIWNITCTLPYPCTVTNTVQEINANTLQYYWSGNSLILNQQSQNEFKEIILFDLNGNVISTNIKSVNNYTQIAVRENTIPGVYILRYTHGPFSFRKKILKWY